jgi:hypothetical protein
MAGSRKAIKQNEKEIAGTANTRHGDDSTLGDSDDDDKSKDAYIAELRADADENLSVKERADLMEADGYYKGSISWLPGESIYETHEPKPFRDDEKKAYGKKPPRDRTKSSPNRGRPGSGRKTRED